MDEKRQRLSLINRYLETNSEIDSVHDSIAKLKVLLSEEEEKKEEYKIKNQIMEDDLYTEFMKVIKEDSSFNKINILPLQTIALIDAQPTVAPKQISCLSMGSLEVFIHDSALFISE